MSDGNDFEELDPRVQVELENLNVCTDEINRLEVQLDESNAQFRTALTECTHRMKCIADKLGSCVEKAKPYYAAVEQTKKEQQECQKAAVQFQRAVCLHVAARERIAQAERRFQSGRNTDTDCHFDVVWQDMLNHDTAKLTTAELQRRESEEEHRHRAAVFASAIKTTQTLEQKLRSAIAKSKSYFDYKALFENELKLLKERVQCLQKSVLEAKERYAQALRNLERISEEIHEKRKEGPREPGVGAETSQESSELELSGRQPMNALEWDYEWESNPISKYPKSVETMSESAQPSSSRYSHCFPVRESSDSKGEYRSSASAVASDELCPDDTEADVSAAGDFHPIVPWPVQSNLPQN